MNRSRVILAALALLCCIAATSALRIRAVTQAQQKQKAVDLSSSIPQSSLDPSSSSDGDDDDSSSSSGSESLNSAVASASSPQGKETHRNAVRSFDTAMEGKVTVVSNHNSLLHVTQPPPRVTPKVLEEQARKSANEETQKNKLEQEKEARKEEEQKQEESANKQRIKAAEDEKRRKEEIAAREKAAEQDSKKQEEERKRQQEQADKDRAKQEQEHKKKMKQDEEDAKRKQAEEEKAKEEEKKRKLGVQLAAGWTNVGSGYGEARLDMWDNVCIVSGRIQKSNFNEGEVLLTLGERCRPGGGGNNRLIFTLQTTAKNARFDLLDDGRLVYVTGGARGGWVSLEGLMFAIDRPRAMELNYGWTHYAGAYRHASASRNADLCMASGLIRSGNWGHIGRISGSDCYPQDGRLIFSLNNHYHITRMDVLSGNGILVRAGGTADHHWVSLDGLSYTPYGGSSLQLATGWHTYGSGYRAPKYTKTGPLCVVTGLIYSNSHFSPNNPIAHLPSGCRPQQVLTFGLNVHMQDATVEVRPNGDIVYIADRREWNWISLDRIKFVARN